MLWSAEALVSRELRWGYSAKQSCAHQSVDVRIIDVVAHQMGVETVAPISTDFIQAIPIAHAVRTVYMDSKISPRRHAATVRMENNDIARISRGRPAP